MFRYIFSHSKKSMINLKNPKPLFCWKYFQDFKTLFGFVLTKKICDFKLKLNEHVQTWKIIIFNKKSWFYVKILKYVQKYRQSRFSRPILYKNIKFYRNRSINKEFHFSACPLTTCRIKKSRFSFFSKMFWNKLKIHFPIFASFSFWVVQNS